MCDSSLTPFKEYGVTTMALKMLELMNGLLITQYSGIVSSDYLALITGGIAQVRQSLETSPLTHDAVLTAQRKLALVKEPLLQLRFEVVDSTKDTKRVLTVFALHELYNVIGKSIETLHGFSHIDDIIDLGTLEFRDSISRHLRKIFSSQC